MANGKVTPDADKWFCTRCGITKGEAILNGCGGPEEVDVPIETLNAGVVWEKQRSACPMELRPAWRRFLWYKLGIKSWML